MSDIEDRLDRLESHLERQDQRIARQQETIERQRERIEQQAAVIDDLRSGDESEDGDAGGDTSISRRGAMKTAGLVGLLGAGAGAATAGPTIGEPGNQVETLYAQGLAGDLTGGTTVTDLVGGGLTVESGSLEPALSSDLTLSNGNIGVNVGPGDVGAAPETHDNTAHTQSYAIDGTAQPPETHGNSAHVQSYAVDGTPQPPEDHGNEAHSSTFATSGEVPSSPGDIGAAPDNHGNEAHSSTFATSGEVPSSPGDIGAAPDNHGNEAHSTNFATSSDVPSAGQYLENDGGTLNVVTPTAWDNTNTSNSVNGDRSAALSGLFNDVTGDDCVICGGDDNEITSDDGCVICGGRGNLITGGEKTGILTGDGNTIDTNANRSVILGGENNQITGQNDANNEDSFIGGGSDNVMDVAGNSNIGSGFENKIKNGFNSSISGGTGNTIEGSSSSPSDLVQGGFIGGGSDNFVDQEYTGILAGENNINSAVRGFIGAGEDNRLAGATRESGDDIHDAAVVTGRENEVSASFGSVLTGEGNEVTERHGAVLAGEGNAVRGAYSVAVGRNATVESPGAFVFADDSEAGLEATEPGLYAQVDAHVPELHRVVSGDSVDTDGLDPETALDRLTGVDIGASETGDGLRFDPETFNEAFDLDGDGLGTLDVDAALLGAVQALAAEVKRLEDIVAGGNMSDTRG